MTTQKPNVSVNGRDYSWPAQPCVVVCIDGSEPDYIEQAIEAGVMPWMKTVVEGRGVGPRLELERAPGLVGLRSCRVLGLACLAKL